MLNIARHSAVRLLELAQTCYYNTLRSAQGPECDFLLVCHSKDYQNLNLVVESIYRYSLNPVEKILVIGSTREKPSTLPANSDYIYEQALPPYEIVKKSSVNESKKGWILQQLLKLYGHNLSARYVAIDCDTVLIKPHLFFTEDKTVLRLAYESPYVYAGIEKMLGISAFRHLSFVCHMMPFKADVMNDLVCHIQSRMNQHWLSALVDLAKSNNGLMSEYNIYARFMLMKDSRSATWRPWLNKTCVTADCSMHLSDISKKYRFRNSISMHIPH